MQHGWHARPRRSQTQKVITVGIVAALTVISTGIRGEISNVVQNL
jgi:hypothetical protein